MFCIQCGTEIPAEAMFCYKCGASQKGGDQKINQSNIKNPIAFTIIMDWKITHKSSGFGFKHWATYYECNEYSCRAIVVDKLSGEKIVHDIHKSTIASRKYNDHAVAFGPEQGQYDLIKEKLIKRLQDIYADGYDSTDAIHAIRTDNLDLVILLHSPDIDSGKTRIFETEAHSFDIKRKS